MRRVSSAAEPGNQVPFLSCRASILSCVSLLQIVVLVVFYSYAILYKSPSYANEQKQASNCIENISAFLNELDNTLDKKPTSVFILHSLLGRYFPQRDCNLPSLFKIAANSKYFKGISSQARIYVFIFEGAGFDISFGVWKETRDTYLESASVIK